jgi:hypothetical protein
LSDFDLSLCQKASKVALLEINDGFNREMNAKALFQTQQVAKCEQKITETQILIKQKETETIAKFKSQDEVIK